MTAPASTLAPAGVQRLTRASEHRMFGGVVAGLARHLRRDTPRFRMLFRVAFVVLAFSGGLGVVLYGAYWLILPDEETSPRRLVGQYVVGAVAGLAAIGLVASTVSVSRFFVPIGLAALGGALVWGQAGEGQRVRWARLSASSLGSATLGRWGLIRLAAGAGMVVAGIVLVLTRGASVAQILAALVVVLVVGAGFTLITGPIWVRLVRDLSTERRELIRAQERADLAAHVHDSVLQTLALIQRSAASPREVARLARGQERELRTLLYGRRTGTGTLASSLHDAAAEVEDDYAITVDVVVVGDAALDPDLEALVLATRESLVNAAKHAGVGSVSLYAEVEQEIVIYVRDRGQGFDPLDVPEDRQGLRGSIRDRMQRHHGTVTVRSAPGSGTEIELRMGRSEQ